MDPSPMMDPSPVSSQQSTVPEDVASTSSEVDTAESSRRSGQLNEALAAYDEAIARRSADVVAKVGRAEVLRDMGRIQQALQAYSEVIAEYPWNEEARLKYAELLVEAKRFDEGERIYRDLIGSYPDSIEPKLHLAKMLREMGRLDEAEMFADLARNAKDVAERPLAPTADPLESEFRFSENAKQVLVHARYLADETRRAGVTSSCLLFGFAELGGSGIDTARFVRSALERSGRYENALAKFRKDYGKAAWAPDSGTGALLGHVSRNVRAIFERAASIALRASNQPHEIHTRHLFAALIAASDRGRQPVAVSRLDDLGIELPALRQEFREFIHDHAPTDNPGEWDAILTPRRSDIPGKTKSEPVSPDAISRYQPSYSIFSPDRAAYNSRSPDESLADELKVGVHAGHLAQLIAAKDTSMPLSIGLFGPWGSGKSYFIDLLDENLRALMRTPGKVFHEKIVQIRFNAWHYLDTNLWANLVCEIFDQLFATLEKRPEAAEQIKKLKSELTRQSALATEAQEALKKAEAVRVVAEEGLRQAVQARAAEEKNVGSLLDDLAKLLVNSEDVKKQLGAAAEGLGLPKLETSFAELEARAGEVRSLGGRVQAVALAIFTGPGWWKRATLLAAATGVPLLITWLAHNGGEWIRSLLDGVGKTIAQVVAAITGLSAWLSWQVKAGNSLVQKVETAYDQVKKVREAREKEDDAAQAQKALAAKRQLEEQARHTLHEAEEKMKTILAELAELAPGRQLIRFLKDRASAEDYKRHLGLVSLVRRDFEQLSELLTKATENEDKTLPQINRIVLYIDDLDRCRADRVIEVLEAVHLLLAFRLFAVVVAVDPRWLRQSLLDHYPRLLGGADDVEAKVRVRQLGRPATPQDYLEKIFQVPFNLQAMDKPGFDALVTELFSLKESEEKDTPVSEAGSTTSFPKDPIPRSDRATE